MAGEMEHLSEKVQYLLDRTEISETLVRYFNALDSQDWVEMRDTLADELDLDFSELFETARTTMDSDDFVAGARGDLAGFEATQHVSPNHVVAINGDQAECKAYMYAWHTVPTEPELEDTFMLRGHYICGFTRTHAGWKMNKLHMTVYNESGNKGIYDVAKLRVAGPEDSKPLSQRQLKADMHQ